MDLGGANFVSNLTIWNVEGVEGNRLSNFYVLLSEQPFLTTLLQVGGGVMKGFCCLFSEALWG